MNAAEVLGFLLPQAEVLQIVFLSLILTMVILTIATTHRYAGPASWEKKWNGGASDKHGDDLGIDHGSVTDIWNAVATGPEKLAEVMPSLLLVVGLLGTFLGLGLALNHASNILGEPSALSASGTANSMQDLLGLLQGLGTKFKTSTWGIAGFLLLKVWSSTARFEEKRLTWSIRKVKAELEKRKAFEQAGIEAKQAAQFAQIGQAAGQIVEGFSQNLVQQVAKLMDRDQMLHKHLLHYLEKNVESVRADLAGLQSTTQERSAAMEQLFRSSVEDVREELAGINTATQASSAAMVEFSTSTQSVINGMALAGERMASGADQVGVAAGQLVNAVDDFKTQFTEVLNSVRTDLGAAIGNMSEQAARTLAQGSQELGNATREISTALGVLSNDVTVTMTEVKGSIEKSLKIQQDGAVLFRRSSDTLNENVTATTELVHKLGEDIQSGLQAVSDSGRRMAGIGKSLDSIAPEMLKLPAALQPLGEFPARQQALLQEVQGLRQGFQDGQILSKATAEISPLLQGLRDALQNWPSTSTLTSQRIDEAPSRAEFTADAV